MQLALTQELLERIHRHGELAYPEEGAGFLLGHVSGQNRQVTDILKINNAREAPARRNRYLMTPQDVLKGEQEAARRGLDVLGIFHSHPDHPNQPSEFDREWAMPWYSYLITSIMSGQAAGSRSWRLTDDRQQFEEEHLVLQANSLESSPPDHPAGKS
jgi:proteasome lid subunit RPN8/RPN11